MRKSKIILLWAKPSNSLMFQKTSGVVRRASGVKRVTGNGRWFTKLGFQMDKVPLLLSMFIAFTALIAEGADIMVYFNRGNSYFNDGKYDRAIREYDMVISEDPNFTDAYYNRGLAYYRKGNYDEAISDFNKVIATEPKDADIYHLRGLAYYKKGNYNKTIEDETKAIAINPNFAEAHHNRGIAYAKKGQHDEAIEDYNKAISIRPNYMEAYFSRGVAYTRKASSDFKKACEMGMQYACDNLKQLSE